MAECKLCGEEYSDKRLPRVSFVLECGDTCVGRIARQRARCSAPAFNKGAYRPPVSIGGDVADGWKVNCR